MANPIGDGYGSIGSCGQLYVWATQTPSTSATLDTPSRGILVTTAGNLTVTPLWTSDSATFPVPAGWLPVRVKAVHSTNSTAQGITIWW